MEGNKVIWLVMIPKLDRIDKVQERLLVWPITKAKGLLNLLIRIIFHSSILNSLQYYKCPPVFLISWTPTDQEILHFRIKTILKQICFLKIKRSWTKRSSNWKRVLTLWKVISTNQHCPITRGKWLRLTGRSKWTSSNSLGK